MEPMEERLVLREAADTLRGEDKHCKSAGLHAQVLASDPLIQQLLDALEKLHQQLHGSSRSNGKNPHHPKPYLKHTAAAPPPPADPTHLRPRLQALLKACGLPASSLAAALHAAPASPHMRPHLAPLLAAATETLFDPTLDLGHPLDLPLSPLFPASSPPSTTWKLSAVTAHHPLLASPAFPDDTPRSRDQSSSSSSSASSTAATPHAPPSPECTLHPAEDPRVPSPPRRGSSSSLSQLRLLTDPTAASKPFLAPPEAPWPPRSSLQTPPPTTPAAAGAPHPSPSHSAASPAPTTPFAALPSTPSDAAFRLSPLHSASHHIDSLSYAPRSPGDFDRAPGRPRPPPQVVAVLKPTLVQLVTENGAIGAKFRPVVRSSSPGALMLAGVVTPAGSRSSSSSGCATPRTSPPPAPAPQPFTRAPSDPVPPPPPPPPPAPPAPPAPAPVPRQPSPPFLTAAGAMPRAAPTPGSSPPTFTDITNTSAAAPPPPAPAPAAPHHPTPHPHPAPPPARPPPAVLSVLRPKAPPRQLPPTVSELLEHLRGARPDVRKHLDKGHITILKESGPTCAACITHFQLAKMPTNWVQHHEVTNPPAYLHGIISRIAHLLHTDSAQALLSLKARRPDIAEALDLRAFECVLEEEVTAKGVLLDVLARMEQQLQPGWADGRNKRKNCADLAARIKRVLREALCDRAR